MKRLDPYDAMIGSNIRLHRMAADMSQTELAAKLGITFQQIQKYEKGTNRVGAGRLLRIAGILKLPVAAFYGDTKVTPTSSPPVQLLDARDAYRLAQSFHKITDKRVRNTLVGLVTAISEK